MTLVKDVEYVLKTATGQEVMRAPRKSDLHRFLNEEYPFETVKGDRVYAAHSRPLPCEFLIVRLVKGKEERNGN